MALTREDERHQDVLADLELARKAIQQALDQLGHSYPRTCARVAVEDSLIAARKAVKRAKRNTR